MTNPSYVSLKETATIPSLAETDYLVVLTDNGPRRMMKSDLANTLSGTVPSFYEWDALASEVQANLTLAPYGYLANVGTTTVPLRKDATIDGTKLIASYTGVGTAYGGISGTAGLYKFDGNLPATGQFWFTTTFDPAGSTSSSYIAFVQDITEYFNTDQSNLDTTQLIARVSGTTLTVTQGSVVVGTFTVTTPLTFLFCLDVDAKTISIYQSALLGTYTLASMAGLAVYGRLQVPKAAGTITVTQTFNVTDTGLSPAAIPGGFVGLQLINAVLPDTSAVGTAVRPVTSAYYHGQAISAGQTYIITSDRLVQVPDIYQLPLLTVNNYFHAAQKIQGFQFAAAPSAPYGAVLHIGNPSTALAEAAAITGGGLAGGVYIGDQVAPNSTGTSGDNVVIGNTALQNATTINQTIALGKVGNSVTFPSDSVIIGGDTLNLATTCSQSVVLGSYVGELDTTHGLLEANGSVLIGTGTAAVTGWGFENCVAIGSAMGGGGVDPGLPTLTGLSYHVAIGNGAMSGFTKASTECVAIGSSALRVVSAAGGDGYNVAVGRESLYELPGGSYNTALGYRAMYSLSASVSSSTAIGSQATVTGSNQLQLGDASTTTYAYGAVQDRSDRRDKTDIRDTILGLDFINALRPVDYRWDMREDYVRHDLAPLPPKPLAPQPSMPNLSPDHPAYADVLELHLAELQTWNKDKETYDAAMEAFKQEQAAWTEANRISNLVHDGSKKRKRYHHGLIADEVKEVMERLGVDFGGYQDHSINGGEDVKSVGYGELIGPTIRAVQELHALVMSDDFLNAIADRLAARFGLTPVK